MLSAAANVPAAVPVDDSWNSPAVAARKTGQGDLLGLSSGRRRERRVLDLRSRFADGSTGGRRGGIGDQTRPRLLDRSHPTKTPACKLFSRRQCTIFEKKTC